MPACRPALLTSRWGSQGHDDRRWADGMALAVNNYADVPHLLVLLFLLLFLESLL
jgi:hypothetical protein